MQKMMSAIMGTVKETRVEAQEANVAAQEAKAVAKEAKEAAAEVGGTIEVMKTEWTAKAVTKEELSW